MRYTAEDFAIQVGAFRRQMAGLARRMLVTLTGGGVWQVIGHVLFDSQRETRQVENYPGIGFAARPPKGTTSAEAVVIQLGGQNNPAIVATRDEAARAKVADIVENESTAYNTVARVHVKADGSIEARTHAGVALELATKADLEFLLAKITSNAGAGIGFGAALNADLVGASPSWPRGTKKLKGE